MKTNVKSILAFSLLAVVFLALKKPEHKAKVNAVRSMIVQGKWKVNLYRDNGADETSNYIGYEFEFKPDGTIIAFKENETLQGNWKSKADERRAKLHLEFASASHLDELSEIWHIIKHADGSLELEDITTGHGGIDYLNFQKIS